MRPHSLLTILRFILECCCMSEIVTGNYRTAMEQGITNRCQSLNFDLFDLPYSCKWQTQVWSDRGTKVSLFSFRNTDMVTIRRFILNVLSSFWGPKLNSVDAFYKAACCCLCDFLWFRPSLHSHVNSSKGYQCLEMIQTLACYWVVSSLCNSFTSQLFDMLPCCTFAVLCCK